jgi:membrane associated rhomboid family serine protease/Flp pilus assembly protein TadD
MDETTPVMSRPPEIPPGSGPARRRVYFYRRPRLPQSGTPLATTVLLIINIVVFALTTLAGGLRNTDVLLDFGASYRPYIRGGHEYWRLVTAMFLHGGIGHLALNMFGLWVLGGILERLYGYGRFAVIYVGAGIGGSVLSMLSSPDIAVGASGAIFGVAGAMVATGYLHPEVVAPRFRRVFGLALLPFIALDLAIGALLPLFADWAFQNFRIVVPTIDNWAHIGGLFTGLALAGLIPPPKPAAVAVPAEPEEASSYQPGIRHHQEYRMQWTVVPPLVIVVLGLVMMAAHYPRFHAVTRLLAQGAQLRVAQRNDQALEKFRAAERLNPQDARPHEELGSLYLQEGSISEAISQYRQAVSLNGKSVEARLGLAQAYKAKGDNDRAQQYLRAVQKDFGDRPEQQYLLAALFAAHKMYGEAIQHFDEALRLNPEMAAAHNDLAWLYSTSDDPRFRDPERALEHARRAVELDHWKEPAFIDTLAEALYANKDYGEAVKVQNKALALDPNNAEYKDHMTRYRRAAGV